MTAPNADTLYSTAWIDVGKEPYILHVPDEHGRYYLMPMLDGWNRSWDQAAFEHLVGDRSRDPVDELGAQLRVRAQHLD